MGIRSISLLAFGLFQAITSAVELKPLSLAQNGGHNVHRDNDYSKLDLLSSETFLWGGMLGPKPF